MSAHKYERLILREIQNHDSLLHEIFSSTLQSLTDAHEAPDNDGEDVFSPKVQSFLNAR